MENVHEIASHSEEVTQQSAIPQADEQESVRQAAFEAFGLVEDEDAPVQKEDAQSQVPPTEQEAERKGIKVKYNKEEVFIDEDKIPEYARKGLNYEKVEERAKQRETELDRVAKLQGFKDHADLVSNLDRLEQEAQQKQQDQFKDMRQQLREEAEDAGLDPDKLEAWLDNHPLLQEANKAIQERQQAEAQRLQQTVQEQWQSKWQTLYEAYPELSATATLFSEGSSPDWYTPEMQARIDRGYDPIDAYELAHKSTIIERNKQMGKQQAIKEQRLGMRAQVETDANADLEPEVPVGLASAFSLFGLPTKAAQKYVKK